MICHPGGSNMNLQEKKKEKLSTIP
jgi:hypothetical protein